MEQKKKRVRKPRKKQPTTIKQSAKQNVNVHVNISNPKQKRTYQRKFANKPQQQQQAPQIIHFSSATPNQIMETNRFSSPEINKTATSHAFKSPSIIAEAKIPLVETPQPLEEAKVDEVEVEENEAEPNEAPQFAQPKGGTMFFDEDDEDASTRPFSMVERTGMLRNNIDENRNNSQPTAPISNMRNQTNKNDEIEELRNKINNAVESKRIERGNLSSLKNFTEKAGLPTKNPMFKNYTRKQLYDNLVNHFSE